MKLSDIRPFAEMVKESKQVTLEQGDEKSVAKEAFLDAISDNLSLNMKTDSKMVEMIFEYLVGNSSGADQEKVCDFLHDFYIENDWIDNRNDDHQDFIADQMSDMFADEMAAYNKAK